MTLLEAIIAFVLLSVVGVVCLDQTRGATQLQVRSAEWTEAVARAESAMAEAAAGVPLADLSPDNESPSDAIPKTLQVREALRSEALVVSRKPWRAGLDRITVQVPLSSGGSYVLERLVTVGAMGAR